MKAWQKRICVVLVLLLLLGAVWMWLQPPDSKECTICCFIKSHAPCLLNLSTGEIGELALYKPHHTKVGELAEVQEGSTFGFFYAAGAKGTRTTEPWILQIRVPMEGKRMDSSHFCRNCRTLLKGNSHGYVLLDLYDKNNPVVYPIAGDAVYTLRCYAITAKSLHEKGEYEITVEGTLDTGDEYRAE